MAEYDIQFETATDGETYHFWTQLVNALKHVPDPFPPCLFISSNKRRQMLFSSICLHKHQCPQKMPWLAISSLSPHPWLQQTPQNCNNHWHGSKIPNESVLGNLRRQHSLSENVFNTKKEEIVCTHGWWIFGMKWHSCSMSRSANNG